MKLLQAILAGIVIGILIAPDKGSATRRKLMGNLSDYKDEAVDYLSDVGDNIKDKAEDVADNVQSQVKKISKKVKSKTSDLKDDVDEG